MDKVSFQICLKVACSKGSIYFYLYLVIQFFFELRVRILYSLMYWTSVVFACPVSTPSSSGKALQLCFGELLPCNRVVLIGLFFKGASRGLSPRNVSRGHGDTGWGLEELMHLRRGARGWLSTCAFNPDPQSHHLQPRFLAFIFSLPMTL